MGIDPYEDEGYIKKGSSPLDDLMSYYIPGSAGFKHIEANKGANYLATTQSYYALAHYYKYISDQTAEEEMDETSKSHTYIFRIEGLRGYIQELKTIISGYVSEIDKYKAEAEEYKALSEKYKAEAELNKKTALKNGVNASNIKLTVTKVSGSAKLKWSKTGSYAVDKYQIYRSTKEASGYKLIATKAKSVSTYKDTTVKKGKTYYYKVRGYRTIDGKKAYTQWSPVVSRAF